MITLGVVEAARDAGVKAAGGDERRGDACRLVTIFLQIVYLNCLYTGCKILTFFFPNW